MTYQSPGCERSVRLNSSTGSSMTSPSSSTGRSSAGSSSVASSASSACSSASSTSGTSVVSSTSSWAPSGCVGSTFSVWSSDSWDTNEPAFWRIARCLLLEAPKAPRGAPTTGGPTRCWSGLVPEQPQGALPDEEVEHGHERHDHDHEDENDGRVRDE